jgi:hypothetical protein
MGVQIGAGATRFARIPFGQKLRSSSEISSMEENDA